MKFETLKVDSIITTTTTLLCSNSNEMKKKIRICCHLGFSGTTVSFFFFLVMVRYKVSAYFIFCRFECKEQNFITIDSLSVCFFVFYLIAREFFFSLIFISINSFFFLFKLCLSPCFSSFVRKLCRTNFQTRQ